MIDNIDVVNDIVHLKFVVTLDNEQAYIDYRFYKNDIAFMHTFVPDSFRGKGVASALAVAALAYAQKEKKKIMLYCPFMSKYVKEHAEYHNLVDLKYHENFFHNGH